MRVSGTRGEVGPNRRSCRAAGGSRCSLACARWLWLAAAMRETGGPEQHLNAAALRRRSGSWAVLGAYVALVAASHVLWISFAPVTGWAADAFHTTNVSIGLLVSVGPLCSAALSIPAAGAVADRY